MVDKRFLPLLHELACCYQAFEQLSGRHVRTMGLTPSQFDILVTLEKSSGMSCGDLGEQTLITKGTLTGVLDRLELKKLIRREESRDDRRSLIVQLTPEGTALLKKTYRQHMEYLSPAFAQLEEQFIADLTEKLKQLQHQMKQYGESHPPSKSV